MSFVQLVSAFRLYNADVLLLALGVTLLTSLLKKTVMKSFDRKFFTLLPFGIGLALYAAWRMATTGSFRPLWELQTLEGGFGCGCAATLYYVVYEQFFRGKFSLSPLLPLLEFLPEEVRGQAAEELYAGARGKTKEEMAEYFKQMLPTYSEAPMSEEELEEISLLLAEFLSSVEKK